MMRNCTLKTEFEVALEAEFLDMYKNCNEAVMIFDITKQWTFSYILQGLPKVASHVPGCMLRNYYDVGEHHDIQSADMHDFIDRLDRPLDSSYFQYAEFSMKSFGLKYLHKFFNILFLRLQTDILMW